MSTLSSNSFLARRLHVARVRPINFDTRLDQMDFSAVINKLSLKGYVKM